MSARLSRRSVLGGVAAAALLAACASDPVPRSIFYRLDGVTPPASSAAPIKGSLEVPPFRAAGIVNERAILFRDNPRQLEQYSYHAWSEPPTVMVQRAVIAALRGANAFQSVVTPEMRMDRDYELIGDLRRLEHVRGATGSAAIELEISVRRVATNQIVLSKIYQAEESAAGDSVDTAVGAFSSGFAKMLAALAADLAALPRG